MNLSIKCHWCTVIFTFTKHQIENKKETPKGQLGQSKTYKYYFLNCPICKRDVGLYQIEVLE